MRGRVAAALSALVLVAGCGGGDGDDGDGGSSIAGGDAGAQAFIECFDVQNFRAVRPQSGEESLFAVEAERRGFTNTPVNVMEVTAITASTFLVFFESEAKAKQALDEIGRMNSGDIPPEQRGPVVVAYPNQEDRANTEAAVNDCL